jgi:hypothetical protein
LLGAPSGIAVGRSTRSLGGMKMFQAIARTTLIFAASTIALVGCVESSFVLAPSSRLPAWFEVPAGHTRDDLKVTMDYYVRSYGREAVFYLIDSDGRTLTKKRGTQLGLQPLIAKSSVGGYPSYEIITVDGVTDLIEHRVPEPVFYICDDPNVREELGMLKRQSGK